MLMKPRPGRGCGIAPIPVLRNIATAALVVSLASLAAGPKPTTALEKIFYDMGVIGYCGLSGKTVYEGFRRQLAEITARENSDPVEIRDARNRALTMVEWEWDNRGLGGFRGWCSSEGEAAVKRFAN